MIRERLSKELKEAMLAKNQARLSTIRLINAAIKDRDIAARGGEGGEAGVSDADILVILGKMIKQRQESARLYEEGGRIDLAEQERAEIGVIEEFLPKQLSEAEIASAVANAVAETKACSIRDMGRVMGVLKERYAGQMDFSKAGAQVKARLGC
ncbi:MAG TPA: GatB/YqeY domain-containing protein [Paracoccaceae bacterium]|nr:GatB/YqeY domain-containing protein [Paracoccaceae bacterium]